VNADAAPIDVHPMRPSEVAESDRIFKLAFATYLEIPDPATFMMGRDMFRVRYEADPRGAICATRDGVVVGSNIIADWGSFGWFGPLTVDPSAWGSGVAQRLLEATNAVLDQRMVRSAALYTFSDSGKHLALYQRYGYWPHGLTAIFQKPVVANGSTVSTALAFSELSGHERTAQLSAVRALCEGLFPGLDVTREIQTVHARGLGETLLLRHRAGLAAFAICHFGPTSEAPPDGCYVKFAAVRPGPGSADGFSDLLDSVEQLAAGRGSAVIEAGMNFERVGAATALRSRGFRIGPCGVRMVRGEYPDYTNPDSYVVDDLR
jgi:GNAT superfamily N-acetyltransferase